MVKYIVNILLQYPRLALTVYIEIKRVHPHI